MTMPKLKKNEQRLVGLAALVILVAVYLNWPQPDTHSAKRPVIVNVASSDQEDVDPEDDTSVHFKRYEGSSRDPFIPVVALNNGQNGSTDTVGGSGKWQLTGITTIDGQTTALVEDSSTQQGVTLKVGDTWNGLRVVSITDDNVNFVNSIGLPTQLGFAEPPAPTGALNGVTNPNTPSINQITPLPPLSPGAGYRAAAFFQNGGGQ
jgi:hypothetical protein